MGVGQRGSGYRLPIPGQQFADAIDRMVGDPREDVAQIGLRVESVHPCGLDKRVHRGGPDAAGVGTCKQVALSSHCQWPDFAFDRIVRHFQAAVCRVARQRGPARQRITDRFRQGALAADLAQRLFQEGVQLGEQRNGVLLAGGKAFRRRAAVDPVLDGEQVRDALQRLLGQRRGGCLVDLVDVTARVGPACNLGEERLSGFRIVGKQGIEARIAVGVQEAPTAAEQRRRMFCAAIG
jgi:hypothetical protein